MDVNPYFECQILSHSQISNLLAHILKNQCQIASIRNESSRSKIRSLSVISSRFKSKSIFEFARHRSSLCDLTRKWPDLKVNEVRSQRSHRSAENVWIVHLCSSVWLVRWTCIQQVSGSIPDPPPHCRVATLGKSFTRAQRLWSYDRIEIWLI